MPVCCVQLHPAKRREGQRERERERETGRWEKKGYVLEGEKVWDGERETLEGSSTEKGV